MREYLVELVSRMTAPEKRCLNSADSISWHAYREAEILSDSSMVDELADYVALEKDKKRRQAAYFILGKLGQKVRSLDCASILISRIHQEENKYVPSSLLVAWRKYRWALLLTGTMFAMLVANYWIAYEIYPFVPK